MLVRCLYASRVVKPLSVDVIDNIMRQSSKNNPKHGITGMLCFANDIFVQVIEGGRDEVCELFNTIAQDARHRDVRLLLYEEIPQRRFGNWTMGRVDLTNINPALLLKYSEQSELNPFKCSGHTTMLFVDELVATGSIINQCN